MFEVSTLLLLALHHVSKKYKAYARKHSLNYCHVDRIEQYILANYGKTIYQ